MKLLIVEDDSDIVLALCRVLRDDYVIDATNSVAGAIRRLDDEEYDAIIFDLNLTNEKGLTICEKIREQGRHTPIMVLSACANVPDKVKLLDSGANDYLTKPFDMEELKARLRVILRQPASSASARHRLVVGNLMLDIVRHQVELNGECLQLRRKEFAVLECLMKNAGSVVSRGSLIDYAWEDQGYKSNNTVDVHIKYLRDKIDRPYNSQMIKTVHGIGYKLDSSPG